MSDGNETSRFAYIDRSDRGKLRLTGPQRAWYLHQITSQAFEDIAPGDSRVATMLTHIGRVVGLFEAVATEDSILCHFESSLHPELPDAIRRYVFATQVEIEDVGDDMGLILVSGRDTSMITTDHVSQEARLIGIPATYLWVARSALPDAIVELKGAGAVELTEAELEATRAAAGIPRWGYDIDTKTFPQEVGIDTIAVHYDKGCYTGQEAMAKIHFRGKVNRKLVRVRSSRPVPRGSEVTVEGDRVGVVTTGSLPVEGSNVGLAVVRATTPSGATVTIDGDEVSLEDAS
ncbi:MAG TPA: hypothetical protein VFK89_02595 [Actinomycetota bacterium]|nr:hypothetical protein [Actinomycetota bacterium]